MKGGAMVYGYCRCSTNEDKQHMDRQINALKSAGADNIFFEYEHGDAIHKTELENLLNSVREGDTIMTTEVSRIARSTKQLCDFLSMIQEKHLKLEILGSITMDCRCGKPDPMTEAFLQMAGVFSQLELSMIRARVKAGMENAKAKGKPIGRPKTTVDDIPATFFKFYPLYKNGSMTGTELAKVSGIGRTSLYKYLKLAEGAR